MSLAHALAGSRLRMALVEAVAPSIATDPDYDERSTALSPSTRRIFQALGCWEAVEGASAAIREIHVSDQGGFGMTRMKAADEGLEALGYVVPNRVLGRVLGERIADQSNLTIYRPAEVERLEDHGDHVSLRVRADGEGMTLRARLAAAADGSRSALRAQLGVAARETDYGQTGITATVTTSLPSDGRAFERFTRTGPLAMLPLPGGHCSLVWTVRSDTAEHLLALPDDAFLAELQQAFGFRLGRLLRVGRRAAWPLSLVRSRQRRQGRTVMVGNAANTLHPVAGQGFNLALRDVAELAEQVHDATATGGDPGADQVLKRYLAARAPDDRRVVTFTDSLVRLFSNRLPGVRLGRNLGLVAMELFPASRRWLMRQAMGRGVRPSRLARGLPLQSIPEQRAADNRSAANG